MRYGPIPENLIERFALAAGKVPLPAIDALYSLVKARSIMAGVKLGIFEALASGASAAPSLAARLALDPSALEQLLRTLVFAGYLEERRGEFALAPVARRSLVAGAPMDLRGFLAWNYEQYEMVGRLEEVVRSGRGLDFHSTMTDPAEWGDYQRAMLEIARFDAPAVAKRVPVRAGATRLLDVAGSHGLLGAAICRRHPPLRSTVLDLPAALPHARLLAREAGHAELVEFVAGDLERDEWGEGRDVILLANILHHFDAEAIGALLARAHAALAGDGTVAIWEIERPRRDRPAGDGDGAALFFRLISTAGTYAGEEYATWLAAAGFERTKIARPALTPGRVLVTARRATG